MKYEWVKNGADNRCELPGRITLVVTPVHYAKGFTPKAARGTKWRAQASHWDASTSTLSRYGRDEYMNPVASAEDAMKLAQSIYEAVALTV